MVGQIYVENAQGASSFVLTSEENNILQQSVNKVCNITTWYCTTEGLVVEKKEKTPFGVVSYRYFYTQQNQLAYVQRNGITMERYYYGNVHTTDGVKTKILCDILQSHNKERRSFCYDKQGQLQFCGEIALQWSKKYLHRVSSADTAFTLQYATDASLASITSTEEKLVYQYANGNLTACYSGSTLLTAYSYNCDTRLEYYYDAVNDLLYHFMYTTQCNPMQVRIAGKKIQHYFGTNTIQCTLLWDTANSLRAVQDKNKALLYYCEYDTFGNAIITQGVFPSLPFGFAGGIFEPASGFVFYGKEFYISTLGFRHKYTKNAQGM